ncbi:ribonuclease P protein component [Anaerocellum diazotrophicum]|uniref:Ribonuclease P protein component n=1 Tax=Caldicellulosiruptor diazotrophicus TaxID=2806205 RepID=A0ABN6EAA8_9FIRM|nr:ribonuclease P protein component [Caldicellulosiruptor diazotrophicus]BCS82471.1 ribonuclease P protein component [Caldicellulosiruptor diazotrophicus]
MNKFYSLKKNEEFEACIKRGRFAVQEKIVVYSLKNKLAISRFGISMSSKFGKATARNRFKRIVRAWILENIDKIKQGFDVVVIARKMKDDKVKAREIHLNYFKDDLEKAFKRLRLLKEE